MTIPNVTLNNDVHMPQLGFGVFQVPAEDTVAAVSEALRAGYRGIDTAKAYDNEAAVGQALRDSGIPRDELFVTTKLWNDDQGYDEALRAFDDSLTRLGLDRLDLYLIHWPAPKQGRYVDTWRAFEKLQADGRVRAIGVSNFQPAHLRRLIDETGAVPAVNQIELHPREPQLDQRADDERRGIVTEAWSPLAQGGLLAEPVLAEIGARHGKTPVQVVLRWHVQQGIVTIPKTGNVDRLRQNLDVYDFTLSDDDMARIATLATGKRANDQDPRTWEEF
jgi:2,5-diketo-D-gluconate reductase A